MTFPIHHISIHITIGAGLPGVGFTRAEWNAIKDMQSDPIDLHPKFTSTKTMLFYVGELPLHELIASGYFRAIGLTKVLNITFSRKSQRLGRSLHQSCSSWISSTRTGRSFGGNRHE